MGAKMVGEEDEGASYLDNRRDHQRYGNKTTLLRARTVGPDTFCTCLLQNISKNCLGKLDADLILLSGSVVHQNNELGTDPLDFFFIHKDRVLRIIPLACQLMEPLLGMRPCLACGSLGPSPLVVIASCIPASNLSSPAKLLSGGVTLQTYKQNKKQEPVNHKICR